MAVKEKISDTHLIFVCSECFRSLTLIIGSPTLAAIRFIFIQGRFREIEYPIPVFNPIEF